MKKYYLFFLVMLMFFLHACEPLTPVPESLSAIITEIEGHAVGVRHVGASEFIPAALNDTLKVKAQVNTGLESRSRIDLSSGTVIRLSPESLFTLESNHETETGLLTRLTIEIGQVWIVLNGGTLEVETPSGLAGVRGSYMSTGYDLENGAARITCLEGQCSAENEAGTVEFTAGEAADLPADGAAPIKGVMTAEEFAMWAENVPEAGNLIPTQVAPSPTAMPMPTATPQLASCTVTSTFLYVRTCPESTCEALGYAELDDALVILLPADTDGWMSVSFEGESGWVNASFCE
ncbi:MAG: FecR domain-containing protein [Anaerolineae bacterium]|jgi:hypothetical protein|nr:FecR domain-containing protein [Anaerolineae bacterium]MBT7071924.1 FecR domain-containing protein [Anaerolineae bacterium]MBT7323938.1 FecR domain-containing protein [Anaerolineae bacterium]